MKRTLLGLLVLLICIVAGIMFKMKQSILPAETVSGMIGGEKSQFLEDSLIVKILRNRYGLIVDARKEGSIELVQGDPKGKDFLWPSSQVALEIFKERHAGVSFKTDQIFSSPLVLFSWDLVTKALVAQKYAQERNGVWYITDLTGLIQAVVDGKKWSDLGVSELYGRVSLISTDPNRSNSGSLFAGLIAALLAGDQLNDSTLAEVTPAVKQYFDGLGFMESSSSDLFNQYLSTGVGAKPIIAGYENQIIEYSLAHPDQWPVVKEKVRLLYPEPTVWSAHPFIALTPKAEKLMKALKDPEIQKIAWERHGFRTDLVATTAASEVNGRVIGIAPSISKVIPLPAPHILNNLLGSLKNN